MTRSHAWPSVGRLDPAGLVDARLQAHHAVQLVVSLAISYLPPDSDDRHTNLEWIPGRALAGRLIPGENALRGALRFDPLILLVLDAVDSVVDEYRLAGRTCQQAIQWLAGVVREAGLDGGKLTQRKHYEIPGHRVAGGAPFTAGEHETRELGCYYEGAHQVLTGVKDGRADASEIRCWPHHFDLATLLTLPGGKTIGAGLSPGDERYAEPYYYVTPYPYPAGSLPRLRRGFWNPSGWVGTVLPASHFAREENSAAQQTAVQSFLDESLSACQDLL